MYCMYEDDDVIIHLTSQALVIMLLYTVYYSSNAHYKKKREQKREVVDYSFTIAARTSRYNIVVACEGATDSPLTARRKHHKKTQVLVARCVSTRIFFYQPS